MFYNPYLHLYLHTAHCTSEVLTPIRPFHPGTWQIHIIQTVVRTVILYDFMFNIGKSWQVMASPHWHGTWDKTAQCWLGVAVDICRLQMTAEQYEEPRQYMQYMPRSQKHYRLFEKLIRKADNFVLLTPITVAMLRSTVCWVVDCKH